MLTESLHCLCQLFINETWVGPTRLGLQTFENRICTFNGLLCSIYNRDKAIKLDLVTLNRFTEAEKNGDKNFDWIYYKNQANNSKSVLSCPKTKNPLLNRDAKIGEHREHWAHSCYFPPTFAIFRLDSMTPQRPMRYLWDNWLMQLFYIEYLVAILNFG